MDRPALGRATILRGDALHLALADNSVDLVVTSPPYFGLRSYQDGGEHYDGQIGDEPTPAEFVDALIAVTAECMRVLKPSGSIWVNLGDAYAGSDGTPGGASKIEGGKKQRAVQGQRGRARRPAPQMTREDAAWLAGVIDSDGSVSIHVNKQPEGRAPSFVPWMRVGQMRPEVVARIAEVTGVGSVVQDGRGVYNWGASAQQARWVLERIHPWLLIKKRQAWAAIEVARHVGERNGRGSYRPLTGEDVAYRQRLRSAVLLWNKGQDDDLQPPEPPAVFLPNAALNPRAKSLRGIPWRYALRCIDDLGLILRAEVIWSKPNGLPESVTDRVRRSHEQWFHFTTQPRYYSAVDAIREEALRPPSSTALRGPTFGNKTNTDRGDAGAGNFLNNPLGKLPGSVWTVPTQQLRVPDHLGIDHFAAFPMEFPRRIITGWSPAGVCTACGEGRRPVVDRERVQIRESIAATRGPGAANVFHNAGEFLSAGRTDVTITGEACDCPEPTAPTAPGVVLDPFGGTGTTALLAKALGRHGISNDMSADYCRLATWRTNDEGELARAMQVEKPAAQVPGQTSLLDLFDEEATA